MNLKINTVRLALACLLTIALLPIRAASVPLYAAPQVPPQSSLATPENTAATRTIKIPAPEGAKGFGRAIAYDGQTLVVTAPQTDVNGTPEQGMVYIYALDPNEPENWELQATATFTMPSEYSGLGESVAVEEDTIVVGAPYVTVGSASQNGAVLIIERTPEDPTWRVTQREMNLFRKPNGNRVISMGSLANFGHSVAIAPGEDGRILVGAPGADVYYFDENYFPVRSENAGGVFTLSRVHNRPDNWVPVTYNNSTMVDANVAIMDDVGEFNALFGDAVAVDTQGTALNIVIGSPSADTYKLYDNQGKAVQYTSAVNSPFSTQRIPETHRGPGEGGGLLGSAVDVHGDALVVGASHMRRKVGPEAYINATGAALIKSIHPASIPTTVYASDFHEYAEFGSAVAIHNGVVAIGSPGYKLGELEGWGAVYRFGLNEEYQWVEQAKYVVEELDGGGGLGRSVEVYDGLIFAGAPQANSTGIVYIFDDREQIETPNVQIPLGAVPDNLEHLAAIPTDDEPDDPAPNDYPYKLLLPAAGYEVPEGTPEVFPPGLLPNIQLLQSDSVIRSNYGARIGALSSTITAPIESYIVAIPPPPVIPDESSTVVGHYYAMGTITASVTTPLEKPLVVGLPVPEGVNPAELAASIYISNTDLLDPGDLEGSQWVSVPGTYDETNNLFVFILSELTYETLRAVLTTNPNHGQFEPPEATAQSGDNPDVLEVSFGVRCTGKVAPTHALCAKPLRDAIAAEFLNAYNDFVGLGFPSPALVAQLASFDGLTGKPGVLLTEHFRAIILHPAPCGDELGAYLPNVFLIRLCLDPTVGVTPKLIRTIRHELFHAIQFAYPNIRSKGKFIGDWVIEGTASAAEVSSNSMLLTPGFGPRVIDVELRHPYNKIWRYPYEVQDFWVYVGQKSSAPLSYLIPIFEHGPTAEDVDAAWGGTLSSEYWKWVKNQVYEKSLTLAGRSASPPCQVEDPLVLQEQITIDSSTSLPWIMMNNLGTLTGTVYSIEFADAIEDVQIELLPSGVFTRFKMYREGEGGCTTVPEQQGQSFDAKAGDMIHIVVANTGYNLLEFHQLGIWAGGE